MAQSCMGSQQDSGIKLHVSHHEVLIPFSWPALLQQHHLLDTKLHVKRVDSGHYPGNSMCLHAAFRHRSLLRASCPTLGVDWI